MNILITGLMGPGTLQAKVEPFALIDEVETVYFLRKTAGPPCSKVKYITLPAVCRIKIFNILFTPVILLKHVYKLRPSLIIGYHIFPYGFFAAFAGVISSTPFIAAQTGLIVQKQAEKWAVRKMLNFVFNKALQVNCPGSESVKFWSDMFPKLKNKFKLHHSTIDTDKYYPVKINPVYDFVFLGRLHKIKNIDLIIKAFSKLQAEKKVSLRFAVAGDGPEKENLKKLADELNLSQSIEFPGFFENPAEILQRSKFFVMASASEGLPTAMMQAMACGAVPVTNLVGNIPDLVKDNVTGFVFNSFNENEIADVMRKAIETGDEKLSEMGEKCRSVVVSHHSHIASAEKWKILLNREFGINPGELTKDLTALT